MSSVEERIVEHIRACPGCTELEVAQALFGQRAVQQRVNASIRRLSQLRVIRRNEAVRPFTYDIGEAPLPPNVERARTLSSDVAGLSEDEIKVVLKNWLEAQGWSPRVAMGSERGIDIEARRGSERWIIEVKGPGSLQPMRVNYFISMLGETLQRMDDPDAAYSIALPDLKQFRGLWQRLPWLAKKRTTISAIFVGQDGSVELA